MRTLLKNTSGQGLVEWTLLLPLFLLLIFGTIDFGFMFSKEHSINNMSRELTRAASIGNSEEELTTFAIDLASPIMTVEGHVVEGQTGKTVVTLSQTGEQDIIITFEPALTNRTKGEKIKVDVQYTYLPFTPILHSLSFPLKGSNVTLVEIGP